MQIQSLLDTPERDSMEYPDLAEFFESAFDGDEDKIEAADDLLEWFSVSEGGDDVLIGDCLLSLIINAVDSRVSRPNYQMVAFDYLESSRGAADPDPRIVGIIYYVNFPVEE